MTEMETEQALFWQGDFGHALGHLYLCIQDGCGFSHNRSPFSGESTSWLLREVL